MTTVDEVQTLLEIPPAPLISDLPLIVFDTETTSPEPQEARIVTAAVGILHPDGTHDIHQVVIDPGIPIPEEAAAVHGWTTERLHAYEGRLTPELGLEQILAGLYEHRLPVVAFNARFDFTLLVRECERHAFDTTPLHKLQVIDPLVIDKQIDKYRKGSRKLQPIAELNGITLTDWHDATADALAAGLLAQAMVRKIAAGHPGAGTSLASDPKALHAAQVAWAADQAASLQHYFRTKKNDPDPTAFVEPAWPIAPAPQEGNPS